MYYTLVFLRQDGSRVTADAPGGGIRPGEYLFELRERLLAMRSAALGYRQGGVLRSPTWRSTNCLILSVCVLLSAILSHPLTLILPALTANAAADIRRRGAVLQVARRAAMRAASSCSDHSSSVLASPNTRLEVRSRSRSVARNGGPRRSRRGVAAAPPSRAAPAPSLVPGLAPHRCAPDGIGRTCSRCATLRWCHAGRYPPRKR
jgi:hypothetical protein